MFLPRRQLSALLILSLALTPWLPHAYRRATAIQGWSTARGVTHTIQKHILSGCNPGRWSWLRRARWTFLPVGPGRVRLRGAATCGVNSGVSGHCLLVRDGRYTRGGGGANTSKHTNIQTPTRLRQVLYNARRPRTGARRSARHTTRRPGPAIDDPSMRPQASPRPFTRASRVGPRSRPDSSRLARSRLAHASLAELR